MEAPSTPPEDSAKSFQSLAQNWNRLISEWGQSQPIVAGYFNGSNLTVGAGEPAKLNVVLTSPSGYELAQSHQSHLRSLKLLIKDQVDRPFELDLTLSPQAHKKEAPPPPDTTRPMDMEDLIKKEPIVGYLTDLFNGSLVD